MGLAETAPDSSSHPAQCLLFFRVCVCSILTDTQCVVQVIGIAYLILRKISAPERIQVFVYAVTSSDSIHPFTGILGVVKDSDDLTDWAFDVLALEALLLVPRYVRPARPGPRIACINIIHYRIRIMMGGID